MKKTIAKKATVSFTLTFAILAISATALLAGCNTMEGLGEDTKAAGRAIENAASGNKSY